jgi:glucose-1-phosphate thymidylyltransferase
VRKKLIITSLLQLQCVVINGAPGVTPASVSLRVIVNPRRLINVAAEGSTERDIMPRTDFSTSTAALPLAANGNRYKGIVLAGGTGTRLHPVTVSINKHLMPVYDKPMIYYPLAILMLAGIRDILIITNPKDIGPYQQLLKDGSQWGIDLHYALQANPDGLPQAFIIAADFIRDGPVVLILGDNIFYGGDLLQRLRAAVTKTVGATVFAYYVNDPERYGVVNFDRNGCPVTIEEKPVSPQSNYAVTGLYFFDDRIVDIARSLQPSARNELEITDCHRAYLRDGQLTVQCLGRGTAWFDAGTHNSLLDAANFIRVLEERQGLRVACLEEVAYHMGFISREEVLALAEPLRKSGYGQYLIDLLNDPMRSHSHGI